MQTTHKPIEHSDTQLLADIVPIQTQDIDRYWYLAADHVQKGIDWAGYQIKHEVIKEECKREQKNLWLAIKDKEVKAAILTFVDQEYRLRTGTLWIAAGKDHGSWVHASKIISDWFKEIGCAQMKIVGRNGWAKKLKTYGFKQKISIYEKDL